MTMVAGVELPSTVRECHELIRQFMSMDDEQLRELGMVVGARMGCTPQAGALLVLLSRANGRPMSCSQLEARLPTLDVNVCRTTNHVRVVVWKARRDLGEDVILSAPRGGYWLSPEVIAQVREAIA